MEFKQTQVETIVLDCNPDNDVKTFVKDFTVPLHINIDSPTGVYVRQITYAPRTQEGTFDVKQEGATVISYPAPILATYTVTSSLISNRVLGSFVSGTSVSPNTFFRLGTTVNSDYTFSIRSRSAVDYATGVLALTLEFVK